MSETKDVRIPRELYDFLLGAGPLGGCWFGDRPDDAKGAFWWRNELGKCAALEPAPKPAGGEPLTFGYTNWRGEFAVRSVIPLGVHFGSTEWHPEPQWLLHAFDTEKQAERDFAMKDMTAAPIPPSADVQDVGELVAALEWYSDLPKEWLVQAGPHVTYGDLRLLGERARSALTVYKRSTTDGQS